MAEPENVVPSMSEIEIIEGDQGDDAWRQMRLGLPTASCFSQIMAQGDGKVRDLLLRKLAGEIVTGLTAENFRGKAMERGSAVEPELRALFAIESGLELRQVAFVRRRMDFGIIGASPDALIGDESGLELKKQEPHVLIETLRANKIPGEFLPQVQGSMFVTGRSSWWVGIGFPGMPMLRRLIKRDSSYCARLEVGLRTFVEELNEMVAWLKRYGRD